MIAGFGAAAAAATPGPVNPTRPAAVTAASPRPNFTFMVPPTTRALLTARCGPLQQITGLAPVQRARIRSDQVKQSGVEGRARLRRPSPSELPGRSSAAQPRGSDRRRALIFAQALPLSETGGRWKFRSRDGVGSTPYVVCDTSGRPISQASLRRALGRQGRPLAATVSTSTTFATTDSPSRPPQELMDAGPCPSTSVVTA